MPAIALKTAAGKCDANLKYFRYSDIQIFIFFIFSDSVRVLNFEFNLEF